MDQTNFIVRDVGDLIFFYFRFVDEGTDYAGNIRRS